MGEKADYSVEQVYRVIVANGGPQNLLAETKRIILANQPKGTWEQAVARYEREVDDEH